MNNNNNQHFNNQNHRFNSYRYISLLPQRIKNKVRSIKLTSHDSQNILNQLSYKERNDETIQKRIRNLINALDSSGLSSHQVTNDDLRMILDNFLNGGQTTSFGTVLG